MIHTRNIYCVRSLIIALPNKLEVVSSSHRCHEPFISRSSTHYRLLTIFPSFASLSESINNVDDHSLYQTLPTSASRLTVPVYLYLIGPKRETPLALLYQGRACKCASACILLCSHNTFLPSMQRKPALACTAAPRPSQEMVFRLKREVPT